MVTIKDVAREVNVSVTTVSRVLNNKPDVSDDTKKKIKNAIEKLGYNPNGIARGLVLQKTHTIGLIIPDINNPFFPEVIKGIEKKSKELGYSLIFYDTDNNKEDEQEAIKLLKSKQVDGIILSLSLENRDILKRLEKQDFPVVQIDRKINESIYPSVTIDNTKSAYKATNYLIELGHTKIGHITGDLSTETAVERLDGFRLALSEKGILCPAEWILQGDYSKNSGKDAMEKIIKYKNRPTALFIANDLMAFGAYEAIFNNNLHIPEDFSIVGHDNIDITSFVRPGLTTMDQPKYKLGQLAAELLIKAIKNEAHEDDIILQNDLIIRESTMKK